MDGLRDTYRNAMVKILSANPRVEQVVLFGSRAMETFSTTSDVDLALFGDELTLDDQSRLAEQLDRLPMPQRVDLVLHHRIKNKDLIDHIQKYGVVWFLRKDRGSGSKFSIELY